MFKFSFVVLIFWFGSVHAAEQMAVTTDISFASKYMIDGFKVGGDHPVLQLSGKTDLLTTGLSFMFWTAVQTDRGNRQFDEQDFFIKYSKDFNSESKYKLNLHAFFDYWMFPNTEPVRDGFGDIVSTAKRQGNKYQLGATLPSAIPTGDTFLVPSYNLYYLSYWNMGRSDQFEGGFQHELMLEQYRAIRLFLPGATYQYAGWVGRANYNGGTFSVPAGLSHSTASLVTGAYALNSIFELTVNHQWTFQKKVNDGNELWTTFSFIKKF